MKCLIKGDKMKYWFVVYNIHRKGSTAPVHVVNVILWNKHPVQWAAEPPENNKNAKLLTTLHFYAEIDESVALAAEKASWCGIERYAPIPHELSRET